MTNGKHFLGSIEEEREIFSLLTDCMAGMGKDGFKIILEKAIVLSKRQGHIEIDAEGFKTMFDEVSGD